ncbi:amino acid decarboxylase, partial [Paenibacillus lemnae]|nr:amino acid decarboxylase [Paenibacillus lemnae]
AQRLPRLGLLQPPQPRTAAGGAAAPGGQALPPRHSHTAAAYTRQDPFKAVIYDRTGSLSGYALQRALEERGCVPEMSDERRVVLLFAIGSTVENANHLLWALQHILEQEEKTDAARSTSHPLPEADAISHNSTRNSAEITASQHVSTWNNCKLSRPFTDPVSFHLTPPDRSQMESIPLEQCTRRIAGEMIIPYPPGIPLLYQGEIITSQQAEQLVLLRDAGAKCQGPEDPALGTIRVFKNSGKQVSP